MVTLKAKALRNLKLHTKFSIVITLLVVAVVASLVMVVSVLQRRAILREVHEKAFGLTSVLAHSSVQAVLTDDYLLLQEIIDTLGSKEDVVYAMILDNEGRVIVHSTTRERGKQYTDERTRRALEARGPLLQRFQNGEGVPVWDLSRPVLTGTLQRVGTARIGFSLKRAYAEVASTRERILLIGLVAMLSAIALSWLLAKTVARPLQTLVEAARRIGAGELSHRVGIEGHDEIGQLASAFNQMGAELLKHREELRQKIDELSRLTEYNENILQSMHSGVVTVDYEGRIITFNRSAEQITGFEAAQAQGQPFEEFLSFCESLRGAIEDVVQAGRVRTDAEAPLIRADGREAVVRFSTRLLNHTNGKIR
ncbi:MAG TPA: HAMP domain-containing protein, partial [Candidatus Latescibacteria bacterium]|nr:HAMP domain-containing protein [Candidatus Latescibacterota bacterium]